MALLSRNLKKHLLAIIELGMAEYAVKRRFFPMRIPIAVGFIFVFPFENTLTIQVLIVCGISLPRAPRVTPKLESRFGRFSLDSQSFLFEVSKQGCISAFSLKLMERLRFSCGLSELRATCSFNVLCISLTMSEWKNCLNVPEKPFQSTTMNEGAS